MILVELLSLLINPRAHEVLLLLGQTCAKIT